MGVMVIMGVMGVSPIKIGRSCNDSVPGRERERGANIINIISYRVP